MCLLLRYGLFPLSAFLLIAAVVILVRTRGLFYGGVRPHDLARRLIQQSPRLQVKSEDA
jgi:hypothetical protein